MSRTGEFSPESLLRLIEENEEFDENLQKVVAAAVLSQNPTLQDQAGRLLTLKQLEQHQYPFTDKPRTGTVKLGKSFSGNPVQFEENDLSMHLLAVGQSGSGKTNLIYNLIDQLKVPYWSFDVKQDYRHLCQDQDLLVLPWSELKFNPLKPPPNVSPRRWAQVLAEIFSHATALLSGSKNYLLKQIIELYRLYNLFEEVSPPYPSLHELELLLKTEKINYVRKTSNYRDTVLNRLETMNLVGGTVFDCSQGFPLKKLLDRNVVFELDGLNRDVQNFLMEILFAYVYEYRLAQNQRDTGLRHIFFLDEGKQVFSVYKERQDAAGLPAIDELTAKMREFGEGLVVADQEASKLTDSIKANTYTKVLLPTGDRKQFNAVVDSLGLSERQREYAQDLGIGEAVVQVGNRSLVPVKLEEFTLEKTVSDNDLQSLMAEEWNSLSASPRERTPEYETRVAPNRSEESKQPRIVDDPQSEIAMSEDADRLLKDVVENPFKLLTERYIEFSSRYKGNKAKDELLRNGVVVERRARTPGGKQKLLEFTKKGRKYVENQLDLDPSEEGRGGIAHRYWQHRIKEVFEKMGWTVKLELFDADVYINMNDSELVVEVAMGNNHREIEHIEKHLEKFDTVWIVCPNQQVCDGLAERLNQSNIGSEQVVFHRFQDINDGDLPV
ncbi:ATP-binding protein [Natrialbaceae archaeon A-chndr2]